MGFNFQKDQQEYVLCAAIWFDDGKIYPMQPSNIETGIVLCGWRHGCIIPQITSLPGENSRLAMYQKEQGFLTSKNRFMSRGRAAEIAFLAGQLEKKVELLYSEDLY